MTMHGAPANVFNSAGIDAKETPTIKRSWMGDRRGMMKGLVEGVQCDAALGGHTVVSVTFASAGESGVLEMEVRGTPVAATDLAKLDGIGGVVSGMGDAGEGAGTTEAVPLVLTLLTWSMQKGVTLGQLAGVLGVRADAGGSEAAMLATAVRSIRVLSDRSDVYGATAVEVTLDVCVSSTVHPKTTTITTEGADGASRKAATSDTVLQALRGELFELGDRIGVDVAVQHNNVYRRYKRLVVFDMDSTLIEQEVIDEIAREAGVVEQVAVITESAMRGEIDFAESLARRVGLLKGAPETILERVRERITLTPGARELCGALRRLGVKMAVISGGFQVMAEHVKATLGLDYAHANDLQVGGDGLLSGTTRGAVVDGARKEALLRELARAEGLDLVQVVAVGDGANDAAMVRAAGLGVAFRGKAALRAAAAARVAQESLVAAGYFLGMTAEEMRSLGS